MTGRRTAYYNRNNIDVQRPQINPPSKYNPTISTQLDEMYTKMIELKPENRQHSIWDLMSEIEILSDNSINMESNWIRLHSHAFQKHYSVVV